MFEIIIKFYPPETFCLVIKYIKIALIVVDVVDQVSSAALPHPLYIWDSPEHLRAYTVSCCI